MVEGSELYLLCEVETEEREQRFLESRRARGRPDSLSNLKLQHKVGDLCSRRNLQSLPLSEFNSIIILADEGSTSDITDKDSRALATLLLIRNLQSELVKKKYGGRRSISGPLEAPPQIRGRSVMLEELRVRTAQPADGTQALNVE